MKGENNDVMVKRLPKKPAPKRFGRSLSAKQKELATHICVDCGWIYAERCYSVVICECLALSATNSLTTELARMLMRQFGAVLNAVSASAATCSYADCLASMDVNLVANE